MQRIDFLTKRATGMVKSSETVKNIVLTLCLSHDFNDFFCFQPYVITIMKNQKLALACPY